MPNINIAQELIRDLWALLLDLQMGENAIVSMGENASNAEHVICNCGR
jgi:hypothetical protein